MLTIYAMWSGMLHIFKFIKPHGILQMAHDPNNLFCLSVPWCQQQTSGLFEPAAKGQQEIRIQCGMGHCLSGILEDWGADHDI